MGYRGSAELACLVRVPARLVLKLALVRSAAREICSTEVAGVDQSPRWADAKAENARLVFRVQRALQAAQPVPEPVQSALVELQSAQCGPQQELVRSAERGPSLAARLERWESEWIAEAQEVERSRHELLPRHHARVAGSGSWAAEWGGMARFRARLTPAPAARSL